MKPACPYCDAAAELVTGSAIYPHRPDLGAQNFWRCSPCDAYVGCHKAGSYRFERGVKILHGGTEPLGRLADAGLRRAKSAAHAVFDLMWKARGMSRKQAYEWLAEQLRLPVESTHIGEFDAAMCVRVVELCKFCVSSGRWIMKDNRRKNMDMKKDVFAEQTFGKVALQKLAPTPENFRLYKAEWLGNKPEDREVMKVTGAEFRAAKTGPNKGKLSILVKGTTRSSFVTREEMLSFDA